jgi:hypothetical protein
MGAQLLLVLLPAGALFGLGASWVVFRASNGRPGWVRSLRVLAVFLLCSAAPVLFFLAFGSMARLTQPMLGPSAFSQSQPMPNLAFERTHNGESRLLVSVSSAAPLCAAQHQR